MKNDELLPCPFCGGKGWYFSNTYDDGLKLHNTRCKKCYAAHDGHPTKDSAITAWNTRHTPSDTKTQYNPADYGDKVSGLSMDAVVKESLTVQKEDEWDTVFKLAEQLGCLEMINLDAYFKYIEEN